MKWRIVMELAGADGSVQSHEISVGGSATIDYSAETLGRTLAEGKKTLAGLQRHLVQAQTEEHCRNRRRCQRCGAQRRLKDMRRRRLTSLFGVVEILAPRFGPCRCGVASRRTITPAAEIMPDRCTPEYERTLAKMGALLPYRRARSLLEEFLPLGCAPKVETIRQRTMHVGARLEHEAVAPPTSSPSSEAGSIALAIDGGHVKSVRSYHVRSSSSPRSPTTPASGSCSAADHHLIVINLNATFTKVFLTGVLSCRDTRSGISNGQIRLFCRRRL